MKVSVLIPCHNEEKTIKKCLLSILNQSRKVDQIVVVNDGSADHTLEILKKFNNQITIVNVLKSTGRKSFAQEQGLKIINGDIFICTDGDTILDKDFIKNILVEFEDKNVAASSGYVKSLPQNWLTSCRQIEYLISQHIHKVAQTNINAMFVIPGCAAAYRTKLFKKHISFEHDTLAEDVDFTLKYHKNNLKLSFCQKAIVYTQDPSSLNDYIQQLRRWHGGNWQNILKHCNIFGKPANALELSLVYLEGLIFPFLLILALLVNIKAFLLFYLSYLTIILGFAVFGSIKDKRFDLVLVAPIHLFVSFINYYIFIEEFVRQAVLKKNDLIWFQPERKAFA